MSQDSSFTLKFRKVFPEQAKLILIIGVILISSISGVFFPPQQAEAQAQEIHSVSVAGLPSTVFYDFLLPACEIEDLIYVSGANWPPNIALEIYLTSYPENGNQNGVFSAHPPVVTLPISLDAIAINGEYYTTINTSAIGDFDTEILVQAPIPGDFNIIDHVPNPIGLNIWTAATDAIDVVDNYGLVVIECEQTVQIISDIKAGVNDQMGNLLSYINHKDGNAIVLSVADIGQYIGGQSAANSPAVYVVYPDDDGYLSANGEDNLMLTPRSSSNIEFGHSTVSGDFNGDGIGDLAVGVPDAQINGKNKSGAVYVYYGLPDNEFSDPQVLSENNLRVAVKANDSFGWSLAVGNFNHDRYDDLAIGIPNHTISGNSKAGMVSVIYGGDPINNHKLDYSTSEKWYQDSHGIHGVSQAGDRFGFSLTTGDFDNNGFDDLAIGVPYENISKKGNAGAVNVIYGGMDSHSKLSSTSNQVWYQSSKYILGASEKNDHFGWSLTTGDFNGDEFDDLAIGVPDEGIGSVSDAGAVNVIYGGDGSHDELSPFQNQIWYQGDNYHIEGFLDKNDNFGYSLTSGDFNRDQYDDLAIGVPNEMIDKKSGAGAVNVIYGHNFELSSIGNQLWSQDVAGMFGTSEYNDSFGWSIIAADFNGDEIDDLGVGIPNKNIDKIVDVGAISIIHGIEGSAEDGWGLNADGNQYWYPG